jgi:hypothetical protein
LWRRPDNPGAPAIARAAHPAIINGDDRAIGGKGGRRRQRHAGEGIGCIDQIPLLVIDRGIEFLHRAGIADCGEGGAAFQGIDAHCLDCEGWRLHPTRRRTVKRLYARSLQVGHGNACQPAVAEQVEPGIVRCKLDLGRRRRREWQHADLAAHAVAEQPEAARTQHIRPAVARIGDNLAVDAARFADQLAVGSVGANRGLAIGACATDDQLAGQGGQGRRPIERIGLIGEAADAFEAVQIIKVEALTAAGTAVHAAAAPGQR